MNRVLALLVVCFLIAASACSKQAPVLNPSFETERASATVVEKAIRAALLNRGWTVSSFRPGRFDAIYRRASDIEATIAVSYLGTNVRIELVRSMGLSYAPAAGGGAMIHRNYNRWITFLERDIQRNVSSFR